MARWQVERVQGARRAAREAEAVRAAEREAEASAVGGSGSGSGSGGPPPPPPHVQQLARALVETEEQLAALQHRTVRRALRDDVRGASIATPALHT